jgi:putative transposase
MAVVHITASLGLSIRKACLLVHLSRTAYSYQARRGDDNALRLRLRELAAERKRFGSPRGCTLC